MKRSLRRGSHCFCKSEIWCKRKAAFLFTLDGGVLFYRAQKTVVGLFTALLLNVIIVAERPGHPREVTSEVSQNNTLTFYREFPQVVSRENLLIFNRK